MTLTMVNTQRGLRWNSVISESRSICTWKVAFGRLAAVLDSFLEDINRLMSLGNLLDRAMVVEKMATQLS
ncbi:MAG: hypothetical protein F6K42_09420 [Leptolyngbya sp. SIO1D8]|nr:hypothetical protein [Leptolyngbya sp. SIO1D8]